MLWCDLACVHMLCCVALCCHVLSLCCLVLCCCVVMCCLVLCVLLCYVNEEEADEEKEEGGRTGGVAAPKRKQEPHQDVGKKNFYGCEVIFKKLSAKTLEFLQELRRGEGGEEGIPSRDPL